MCTVQFLLDTQLRSIKTYLGLYCALYIKPKFNFEKKKEQIVTWIQGTLAKQQPLRQSDAEIKLIKNGEKEKKREKTSK